MDHQLGREHLQVYVDENGILNVDEQRKMTKESVAMMRAKFEEILASGQRPALGIVDLTGVELSSVLPLRAKIAEASALITPKKIAVTAKSRLLWVSVSFLGTAIGMLNTQQTIRFFRTKAEGMKWLLKNKTNTSTST